MPRWTFYTREGVLAREEKDTIAEKVTGLYVGLGIPAFWVNVFFKEFQDGGFYCGGKSQHDAVFFHLDHAARKFPDEKTRAEFIAKVNEIVSPFFTKKAVKWEYNIYEHPPDNWRINGMVPPMNEPETLRRWIDKNEAIPYGDSSKAQSIAT